MKQFQVKCRRCRHWLMSEESIVDCHGESVQGDVAGWYCGAGAEREQIPHSHLFVSFSDTPPFIMTVVEQACYTQGKINCPKCQGRLGSFDFVRTNRKCPCGDTALPPIHLLRDRIDLLPSAPQRSALVSPAGQATSATFSSHKLTSMRGSNDIKEEGEDGKGGETDTAESDMNAENVFGDENVDTEENRTTEKTTRKERSAVMGIEGNTVVQENEDSEEYVITDLRWLFGELPCYQRCCACTDAEDAETVSATDTHNCQRHSNTCPCRSEDSSSSETATHVNKQCSNGTMQNDLTSQGTNTSHSQQKTSVTMALHQDCSESRDGWTMDLQRPNSGSSNNYSVAIPTQNRAQIFKKIREIRRRRKKCRDYDGRDELDDMNFSDMSESPVHFPVIRPQSISLHCLREKERRERQAEEKRQIQEENLLWDHTCPMCLDVMWSPHTTLPCEHNFCEGCLRRLTTVISPSKSDCPLCRRRIAQCIPNTDLEVTIQDKYPAHLRLRRREEKRSMQRVKHTPLPGLPFPHRYLSQLPRHRLHLPRACVTWVAVVMVSLMVVVMLSSLGMAICKKVLHKLAEVYDDVMERLTGERLWSRFMGGESRMLTVSCVFVLYLLVACVVQYLQLFQHLQN